MEQECTEPSCAQRTALEEEIARLKAEVAFKDSLIWTSRVSALYEATVVAEKRAAHAEAALTALSAEHARAEQGYQDQIRLYNEMRANRDELRATLKEMAQDRNFAVERQAHWETEAYALQQALALALGYVTHKADCAAHRCRHCGWAEQGHRVTAMHAGGACKTYTPYDCTCGAAAVLSQKGSR